MNRMILPSASVTSFSTAFSRSSNSPRYFAPATSAPMSRATILLSFSPSGTSPRTMRPASPSTIAVLPTPGSPMSTGLFLVRRDSTWITRRISSSRPMTGSSLPRWASAVRSRPYRSSAWYLPFGVLIGDALRSADARERLEDLVARDPARCEQLRGGGAPRLAGDGDEQVLRADVLVLQPLGLRLREVHDQLQPRRDAGLRAAVGLRSLRDLAAHDARELRRVCVHLAQYRGRHAVLLLEQRDQQVLRLDLRVTQRLGQLLRAEDGFLGLFGEFVQVHVSCSPVGAQFRAPAVTHGLQLAPAPSPQPLAPPAFLQLRQRLEMLALLRRQRPGQLDVDGRKQVAALLRLAAERHPVALQPEHLAVLGRRRAPAAAAACRRSSARPPRRRARPSSPARGSCACRSGPLRVNTGCGSSLIRKYRSPDAAAAAALFAFARHAHARAVADAGRDPHVNGPRVAVVLDRQPPA